VRLIFFGNPKFAVPSLRELSSSRHEIAAVVTSTDKPSGRGRKLRQPEVKIEADRLGIPVLQVEDLRGKDFLDKIAAFAAALFVVVAFRILPPQLFEIPPQGAINLHASLLPKYRGAAPINRAIVAGETETGLTTFQIKKRVDTGDVLMQDKIPIHPDDNYDSLSERMSDVGARLLVATVDGLESGTLSPIAQDPAKASPAPKIKPEEGEIDWSRSAAEVRNQIRGFTSKPGAYTFLEGGKLKVFSVQHADIDSASDHPGEIVRVSPRDGIFIVTGDGVLEIVELQPSGKKRMKTLDYLRGHSLTEGTVLG